MNRDIADSPVLEIMNEERYRVLKTQAVGYMLERDAESIPSLGIELVYLTLEFADGIVNVYNAQELEPTTAALTISTYDAGDRKTEASIISYYRDKVQGKFLPYPTYNFNGGGKRGVQVSTVQKLFTLLDYLHQQSEPVSRRQMEHDLGIYVTGLLTHHQTRLTLVSLNELELVRPVRVKMKHFDRENIRKRLYELTAKGRESGKEILEMVYSQQCAILETTEN